MAEPVTIKTIARRAGLSVAAVSYALRGSPKVSPEVRERVRALARKLGYRPNPRVGELMARIRAGRAVSRGEVIALVCLEGRRGDGNPFLRAIELGARERAAARGFGLAVFWLEDVHGSVSRLAAILRARGVAGVVFAPVQKRVRVELDWPWDAFPFAVIGMAEWSQPVARAGHHHFEGMRRAIRYLHEAGARRAACWLNAETDDRAHRGWRAAWLASDVAGAARRLMLVLGETDRARAAEWLGKLRPDFLVVAHLGELETLRAAGWAGEPARTVLLDWRPGCGAVGIDQNYGGIAASAVDLVVAQLHNNTRGLPETPSMLLFPGVWREE